MSTMKDRGADSLGGHGLHSLRSQDAQHAQISSHMGPSERFDKDSMVESADAFLQAFADALKDILRDEPLAALVRR